MVTKREKALDFFRGIAALNIIMIHTVFHSGSSYVPYWFSQIFLLLDVPVFFFLAGWSNTFNNSLVKTCQGIRKLWLDWGLFTICVVIGEFIIRKRSFWGLFDIGQAIFAFRFPAENFPSVSWSTWFMPVYIGVVLIFGNITKYAAKHLAEQEKRTFLSWLTGGVLLLFLSLHFLEGEIITLIRPVVAYGFIFLVGYRSKDMEISWKNLILGLFAVILVWIVSGNMLHIKFYDLQSAKFPVTIMYLAASGLGILLILFLKHRIPEKWMSNIVCHVGKNAICYYFAQGIGASVLYHIVPHINLPWLGKVVVCYLINLLITIVIAEIFGGLKKIIKKIQKRKIREQA